MFPSPEDIRAHKSSASRIKNQSVEVSRRIDEIETPEELIKIIVEILSKRYRQGSRIITFDVGIPVENFSQWAMDAKHASKDMDQLDRFTIKQELTRIVKQRIKALLAQGCYVEVVSVLTGNHRLTFKMKFHILNPK